MVFIRIATLAVLSAVVVDGAAQQALSGTDRGVVEGRVLAADTGLPVSGATVRLTGRTVQQAKPADDLGYFEFSGVPVGAYLVTAVMGGTPSGPQVSAVLRRCRARSS
jgi:hypothetical protein